MDWIGKRIEEARAGAPVADGVAAHLQGELYGPMRERALRAAELAELARALIAASEPPKGEGVP